jgi:hypothetical protein
MIGSVSNAAGSCSNVQCHGNYAREGSNKYCNNDVNTTSLFNIAQKTKGIGSVKSKAAMVVPSEIQAGVCFVEKACFSGTASTG